MFAFFLEFVLIIISELVLMIDPSALEHDNKTSYILALQL